jgi:hypothetical protein
VQGIHTFQILLSCLGYIAAPGVHLLQSKTCSKANHLFPLYFFFNAEHMQMFQRIDAHVLVRMMTPFEEVQKLNVEFGQHLADTNQK